MAMWKTTTGATVRAYFKIVKSGSLVTGIPAIDFTCLLINPADSANQALTVTESTQQPGTYYVDIPSAFLTTHGAGHYGLSLGVHTTGPKVDDESLESVEVVINSSDDHATTAEVDAARDAIIVYVGQKIP